MSGEGQEIEGQVPDPARWRILVVLLVTMFMSIIGVSIVNAVPSIQKTSVRVQSPILGVVTMNQYV